MKPFASFFRTLKETIKCYGRVSKFVLVLFKFPFTYILLLELEATLFFTEVEIKYEENEIAKTSLSSSYRYEF